MREPTTNLSRKSLLTLAKTAPPPPEDPGRQSWMEDTNGEPTCLFYFVSGAIVIGVIFLVIHLYSQANPPPPLGLDEYIYRDAIVQQCLLGERYTRAECIALAARGGQ